MKNLVIKKPEKRVRRKIIHRIIMQKNCFCEEVAWVGYCITNLYCRGGSDITVYSWSIGIGDLNIHARAGGSYRIVGIAKISNHSAPVTRRAID